MDVDREIMDRYNILEVANTHGGSLDYIFSLLDEFQHLDSKNHTGIKFQVFKPDGIALKDFEYYNVYEELYFDRRQWKEIISRSGQTKEVWIDVFDAYGVQIISENKHHIRGIKLQTSVLENHEVINALANEGISDKLLIINIAGREIDDIRSFINFFEMKLRPAELLLEVGFQSYPTAFEDSGLAKVKMVKEAFNKRIVFADHLDGNSPEALQLPVYAMLQGASIIEKHVMHSKRETKYDTFSSITVDKFKQIILNQKIIENAFIQPFLNERELHYFVKSNQIPLTNISLKKGTRLTNDILTFKRTSQKGITYSNLKTKLNGRYYLAESKEAGKTFNETDFYVPKVATIIAVRLKSSRLKEKAKLKIGNLSSIELCLKHALRFTVSDYTILATSTTEHDAELKNYTYSKDVIFHQGDPEDVITRYLSIAEKLNIDIIIRITGDNAFVCKELADFLLQSHISKGADYTTGLGAPIGANMEIMNVTALRRIKDYFKSANYSEYMTWYFTNNPEYFNLNFVELPNEWIGDYRLTLDYEEDLEMYNRIMKYYEETHSEFSLASIVAYLKANPEIAKMNAHIELKFKTDQALIDTLNKATRMV